MTIRLADLGKGDRARVVAVEAGGAALDRLQELGLTVGTELVVEKVAPLGDPIEIEFRGQRLCVRRDEAAGLVLDRVPSPAPETLP